MLPDDFTTTPEQARKLATDALKEADARREFVGIAEDLDRQAADTVRRAVEALNAALAAADARGLDIDISFRESAQQFVLLRISKTL